MSSTIETGRPVASDEEIEKLKVNEIYASIQGESTLAGRPCTFIRLTFCDLRCRWCDTEYAFYEGDKMTLNAIVDKVRSLNLPLVELTGGEPLAQPNSLSLMKRLCDAGFEVMLETGGHRDIAAVDARVRRIMDLKCPGSGMSDRNRYENIALLTRRDEVKFVISSRDDYEWARDAVGRYNLPGRVNAILFSAVFGEVEPRDMVAWILEDRLPVRFQLQMHKLIWDPKTKGV
ncbi:MAG: radical SAM protein [Candidatus Methylacidiphilales bacterium]